MNKRQFMTFLSTGSLAALGGGYYWLTKERDHSQLGLDLALERLDKLDLGAMESNIGEKSDKWELSRTFQHLAQGVDFSIDGYPELKGEVFRKTVGKLAFNVFQARGKMKHNLSDPIPGEVVLEKPVSAKQALEQLKQSMQKFQKFEGALQPHFAYGQLQKHEFAIAHVMHVNNHLEEFKLV